MRALINTGMWVVVAVIAVCSVATVAVDARSSARSTSTQGVLQLQHAGVALIEDSEVGLGLDVAPHFRFADTNVDSTLLDDLNNMLLQTQARAVREQCKLLGNWFGYVIQATLGVVAFGALLIKKALDVKKRDWPTWIRDTSKQAVGSLAAHFLNLLFATLLKSREDEDPCVYYLVNYLVDSVLGCILSLLMLWGVESMADKYNWSALRSGDYGGAHAAQSEVWSRWAIQCSAWVGIITLSKLVLLFCFIVPAKLPLYVAGAWMMSGLVNYPRLELVVVMIIIPLVFNVLQFWIQDNFLMNNDDTPSYTSLYPDKYATTKHAAPMPPSQPPAQAQAAPAAAASASSEPSVTITVPAGGDASAAADASTQSLLKSD